MGATEEMRRELISRGRTAAPSDILRRIGEIEGEHALAYQPNVSFNAKITLHEHFIPRLKLKRDGTVEYDPKKTHEALSRMWARVREKGLNAAGLLTHSTVDRKAVDKVTGQTVRFTPESLYDLVDASMPKDLRGSGFALVPSVEFMAGRVEVVVISSDRDSLFKNGKLWGAKNAEDIAREAHDNPRLAAFFPHPFLDCGGAAHEGNLGLEETRRLMAMYGVGLELSGMFREIEIAARPFDSVAPLIGLIPVFGRRYNRLREMVARTDSLPVLLSEAKSISVGGDFHLPERYIGEAAMFLTVSGKPKDIPLQESYIMKERPSGLVVLSPSGKAKGQVLKENMAKTLKAGRDGKTVMLPGYGQSPLKAMTMVIAEMLVGHRIEQPLLSRDAPD